MTQNNGIGVRINIFQVEHTQAVLYAKTDCGLRIIGQLLAQADVLRAVILLEKRL